MKTHCSPRKAFGSVLRSSLTVKMSDSVTTKRGKRLKRSLLAGGEVDDWVNRTDPAAAQGSVQSNGHTLTEDDQRKP